jgi:hypothetical protein
MKPFASLDAKCFTSPICLAVADGAFAPFAAMRKTVVRRAELFDYAPTPDAFAPSGK